MREERRITDLFTWRQISLCDLGGVSFWEPEMFKVISPNRGDAVSHRTFYRSSPFCPLLLWTGAGIVGIHLGYWFRQEPISTIFSWGFSCLRVIHKPKLSPTAVCMYGGVCKCVLCRLLTRRKKTHNGSSIVVPKIYENWIFVPMKVVNLGIPTRRIIF